MRPPMAGATQGLHLTLLPTAIVAGIIALALTWFLILLSASMW